MRLVLLFGFFSLLLANAQGAFAQTKFVFTYDKAGNRTERYPESVATPADQADVYLVNGRHVHVWPNPLTQADQLSMQINDFNASDTYSWKIISLQGFPIRQGAIYDANPITIPNMGMPGSYVLYFTVNAVTANITVIQQ